MDLDLDMLEALILNELTKQESHGTILTQFKNKAQFDGQITSQTENKKESYCTIQRERKTFQTIGRDATVQQIRH